MLVKKILAKFTLLYVWVELIGIYFSIISTSSDGEDDDDISSSF